MKILFVLDDATFKGDILTVADRAAPHVDMMWYRIKNTDANTIYEKAKSVRQQFTKTSLILSERADIAFYLGFEGVHLGINSISPEVIKKTYPDLIVGYSAHSVDEVDKVDADYFTLSPIFYTEKEYEVSPLGPIDVTALNKPIYALGGISASNASFVCGKGFGGVAGIGFVDELSMINEQLSSQKK